MGVQFPSAGTYLFNGRHREAAFPSTRSHPSTAERERQDSCSFGSCVDPTPVQWGVELLCTCADEESEIFMLQIVHYFCFSEFDIYVSLSPLAKYAVTSLWVGWLAVSASGHRQHNNTVGEGARGGGRADRASGFRKRCVSLRTRHAGSVQRYGKWCHVCRLAELPLCRFHHFHSNGGRAQLLDRARVSVHTV